jgi:hypothetical protein
VCGSLMVVVIVIVVVVVIVVFVFVVVIVEVVAVVVIDGGRIVCCGEGGSYRYEYGVTNIEYTEFKRLGILDEARSEGSHLSVFPANTNLLYVSLQVDAMNCRKLRVQ